MSQFKTLLVLLGFVALAGCASQDIPDPDPDGSSADGGAGADTGIVDGSGSDGGEFLNDPNFGGELATVIYFAFDSSDIRPQDIEIVEGHAQQLSRNARYEVRLEGHADERGSREYNIGLGERRAQSVRRLLLLQGAGSDQISTVSFGEERPAVDGSSEAAWAQNRRVEIIYTTQ
ncbi:MAG: peptidoglycan-associated lipoprotein Pal [Woeseiaceae bacterium]